MPTNLSAAWCKEAALAVKEAKETSVDKYNNAAAALEVVLKGSSPTKTCTVFSAYLNRVFVIEDRRTFRTEFGFFNSSIAWGSLADLFFAICAVNPTDSESALHASHGFADDGPWKADQIFGAFSALPQNRKICCRFSKPSYSPALFDALWIAAFGDHYKAKCPLCVTTCTPSAMEVCHIVAYDTVIHTPDLHHLLTDIKNLEVACHRCNLSANTVNLELLAQAQVVLRAISGIPPEVAVIKEQDELPAFSSEISSKLDQIIASQHHIEAGLVSLSTGHLTIEAGLANLSLGTPVSSRTLPSGGATSSSGNPFPGAKKLDPISIMTAQTSSSFLFSPEIWDFPLSKEDARHLLTVVGSFANPKHPQPPASPMVQDLMIALGDLIVLAGACPLPSTAIINYALIKLWATNIQMIHGKELARKALFALKSNRMADATLPLMVHMNRAMFTISGPPVEKAKVEQDISGLIMPSFLGLT